VKKSLIAAWCRILIGFPEAVILVLLALTIASAFAASRLSINTNQLDLISQDLRQVKDVKRVVDMVGGAGNLILALRGDDEAVLKVVSDDLTAQIGADSERIRSAKNKLPIEFLKKNAALFMETNDVLEVKKRVMDYVRDAMKRASPFFIELKKTEPVKLHLDDILEKYRRVGKKNIDDDYYISADRKMVMITIKPMWDSNELGRTEALVDDLRTAIVAYNENNGHQAKLAEGYDEKPPAGGRDITFGFTGSYKTNYDDSNEIKTSLAPVSALAFIGVLITLLLFFRRHFVLILLAVSALVVGVMLTFGLAKVSIGRLNMITAILGGILMGIGIDFGIHFTYRMRIELGLGRTLTQAVSNTVANSGPASFAAAAGVAGAFFSLVFSEFKGFSEFGFLAGVGVFIIGAVMYLWVPAFLLVLEKRWPDLPKKLVGTTTNAQVVERYQRARVKHPRAMLAVSLLIALGLMAAAPKAAFEYNSRALMVENQPSVKLQDEINARFQISADPVAIYSKTLEEVKQIHHVFEPLDRMRFSTVDQVVSLYSFVPPREQQERNAKILEEWRKEIADIDRASIPPEIEKRWDEMNALLQAKPFDLDDVPDVYRRSFTHLPMTKIENHGFLTFIYPVVDLWDGKQMLRFADEVEEITTQEGGVYHSAGVPILFAKLARIVLFDGKVTVLMTTLLLLVILVFDFRSIRDTAVALLPLVMGLGAMLGLMALFDVRLNFMNVVVLPIVLGYGISHGVYLLHRFNEGVSPKEALRSVGAAVACSTLTAIVGWAALLAAPHRGLKSMGIVACIGMSATLFVSFTVMMAVLQLLHDKRTGNKSRVSQLLAAIMAFFAAGCATTVRHAATRPDYETADKTRTVRLAVVTAPMPGEDRSAGLLFSRIAQRYVNHHRDFIARTATTAAAVPESACLDPTEGVLHLAPSVQKDTDAVAETLHARLYRCRDGIEIWSADSAGSWSSKDETVSEVIRTYTEELGPSVTPLVAPAFHLLRATLETLPYPALPNDEYVMEKIELSD
jgi:uncharacterized protein